MLSVRLSSSVTSGQLSFLSAKWWGLAKAVKWMMMREMSLELEIEGQYNAWDGPILPVVPPSCSIGQFTATQSRTANR